MQDEREPVRLPLDTRAVQNWLSAHGQAFKDVRVLAQFGAGQSNPTYLLQARALWWLEGTRLEGTRCQRLCSCGLDAATLTLPKP